MPTFLEEFFGGTVHVATPSAWHFRLYRYWREKSGGNKPGSRENLCHYVRVVAFWVWWTWFWQAETFYGLVRPWVVAMFACLYALLAVSITGIGIGWGMWGRISVAGGVGSLTVCYLIIIDEVLAKVHGRTSAVSWFCHQFARKIPRLLRITFGFLWVAVAAASRIHYRLLIKPVGKEMWWCLRPVLAPTGRRILASIVDVSDWLEKHERDVNAWFIGSLPIFVVLWVLVALGLIAFKYPMRFGMGVGSFVAVVSLGILIALARGYYKRHHLIAVGTREVPIELPTIQASNISRLPEVPVARPKVQPVKRSLGLTKRFFWPVIKKGRHLSWLSMRGAERGFIAFLDGLTDTVQLIGAWFLARKRKICPFMVFDFEETKEHA